MPCRWRNLSSVCHQHHLKMMLIIEKGFESDGKFVGRSVWIQGKAILFQAIYYILFQMFLTPSRNAAIIPSFVHNLETSKFTLL